MFLTYQDLISSFNQQHQFLVPAWFQSSQSQAEPSPLLIPDYQDLAPPSASMERVQHMTKSAIRRASQIEVTPQAKRNLQELFVNFTLILICLLLIYIIVLLSS